MMNNLLKTSSFIFSLLIAFSSFSQQSGSKISGQVLDLENATPIPFASVYIASESIGTTTNEEGFFTFHIPAGKENNLIVISMIGYATISKKGSDFSPNQKIFLSSEITELQEVTITGTREKNWTAKDIVQKAYQAIPDNFPDQAYILEGYVRDLQKEEEVYVEYLECAAKFLYKGYQTQREPVVEILGVKSNYLAEKHPWNKKSERKNSIMDLVEDDPIRFDYGPILGKGGWKYELESILPYNNRLVYKIKAFDKPFQSATLFIDTESFAFVRLELTRQAIKNRSWGRRFSNGALQVYYNLVMEFQEYKGKMYLKYQKEEDTWRIFKGLESNKVLFTRYPKKELFINKIVADKLDAYPFKMNMDIGTSIENQAENYDPAFWNSYNVPQQTAKESKIIAELKNRTENR